MSMTIGDRIAARRKELGMTQLQLAKKLGYTSKTTISRIETGSNKLKLSKVKAIADALEISPTELIGIEKKPEHNQDQRQVICDLMEKCYGHEAYQMVVDFLKLDHDDKIKIHGRILGMLDTDKYNVKKELSG